MTGSIPSSMKAWLFGENKGGIEQSIYLDTSASLPKNAASLGPDETLVQILATSINPVDFKGGEIPYIGKYATGMPYTPSSDYAGRVVATGPNSGTVAKDDLKPGQLVFGRLAPPFSKNGTLAEYAVATSRAGCVPLPAGISAEDAASIGTGGLTAYQCIVPYLRADAGQSVFIHGGSGGTGTFGIQFAKAMGCYVVATASTAKVEACKRAGADEVIDYKKEDVVAALKARGRLFDLVVDNVGMPSDLYYVCHQFTKPSARYVQVGATISPAGILNILGRVVCPAFLGGGQRPFTFLTMKVNYEGYTQIAQWIKEGRVKAVVDQVYEMKDAREAYARLKSGKATGNIVVKVSDA